MIGLMIAFISAALLMTDLTRHANAPVYFDQAALRRGFLVTSAPGLRLLVDTGGETVASTSSVASAIKKRFGIAGKIPIAPHYIDRYYGGIGVQGALGARWIAENPFTADFGGSMPTGDPPRPFAVSLRLIDRAGLDAYVRCSVAGQTLMMLFDTGALAWQTDLGARREMPRGVNFVSGSQFNAWRSQCPQWQVRKSAFLVVRENGKLYAEPAIRVPDVRVGSQSIGQQWFVRRSDDTTYRWLKTHDGVDARGDLGLAAFATANVLVDYPHARLVVLLKRKERETSILVRAPHLINRQAAFHLVFGPPLNLKW